MTGQFFLASGNRRYRAQQGMNASRVGEAVLCSYMQLEDQERLADLRRGICRLWIV